MSNRRSISDHAGFTLIELMIALVISGIISAVLYATYLVQQRSYTAQDAVAEMQQNLRAGMMLMSRDIRMAGYDPGETGNFVISTSPSPTSTKFVFTADFDGNGSVTAGAGETMTYELFTPSGAAVTSLRRIAGQASIADNIERIEFQYLDAAGIPLPLTGTPPHVLSPNNIRAVRVSILARASRPDRKFTNTKVYTPASGTPWDLNGAAAGNAPNDNFRRRLLITTIQCRNMGL